MKQEKAICCLTQMWRIRLFEKKLQNLYQEGKIHGTIHSCVGQEAVAVGVANALHARDLMTSTHRNHGHFIAKGMSIYGMLAEILGRKTGLNHGKGGSMHLFDMKIGALGSNGIVGGGFPIATGAALASVMQKTKKVVVCFAGDGAVNQGSFHEAANIASIWHLPVIFVVENNRYAMSSDIEKMVNIDQLSKRAESYGIKGITIDGNDLELVEETLKDAVNWAREGFGPMLIEAMTYRQAGHSKSDEELYRHKEECERWKRENDPLIRFEQKMIDEGCLSTEEIKCIQEEQVLELETVFAYVQKDDAPSLDKLCANVYAGRVGELFD
ncbi:MAG: thiamine pyrophosphate-dependent dehydrogenase E1 component subunit alpha [Streptococcaceae bacterium]|nr:thiamine pyrophosphate-dependent dehydrogenase E1 component subunit alpha [Streptococcaceae bacterium]